MSRYRTRKPDPGTSGPRSPRRPSGRVQPPVEIRQSSPLREKLDSFVAAHQEPVISRNRIINPLLELWDLVQHESPEAALPVERLLSDLVGRHHTSAGELARMVDDVVRRIPDTRNPDTRPDEGLAENLKV
jgi:hypothetical protein